MSVWSVPTALCTRHRPFPGEARNNGVTSTGAAFSTPTSPPPTPPPSSSASLHPLVTQPLVDTKQYFCPFLERGYCREADSCKFSHDNVTAVKIPSDYCHFYLANQCLYGEECKFRHSEPVVPTSAGSATAADQQPTFCDQFPSSGLLDAQGTSADSYALVGQSYDDAQLFNEMSYRFSSSLPALPTSADMAPEWDQNQLARRSISHGDTVSAHLLEMYSTDYNSYYTQMDPNIADCHEDPEGPTMGEAIKPGDATQNPIDAIRALIDGRRMSSDSGNKDTILGNSEQQSTSGQADTNSVEPVDGHSIATHLLRSGPRASRLLFDSKNLPSPSTSSSNSKSYASTSDADNISEKLKSVCSITSYAKICKGKNHVEPASDPKKNLPLCPYSSTTGVCQFPAGQCSYLHGLDCDLCARACLHPYDPDQQRQHRDDCLREHEREMELSFAVQRSKDKVCGICMDTVVEKKPVTSSRFGILEKCNHIFCLDCIRKWRGTKQFETRTIRACPECRVSSDFVVPSKYWVEDQDDKDKLIGDYKSALRSKPCKYFDEGKGDCPFAGSCFYRHAYPDGRIAKEDTPKPRRRVYGARGPTTTEANYILWNILTSTGDDDGISFAEYESLYVDPDYMSSDEDDLDEDDLEGHLYL